VLHTSALQTLFNTNKRNVQVMFQSDVVFKRSIHS